MVKTLKNRVGAGIVAVGLLMLSACGPDKQFSHAQSIEKKGDYPRAWELYQEFAAKNPRHPAAAQALFRAGWLAQKQLKDCVAAKAFYDLVVQRYPQATPWSSQAAYFRNNCPDFFPIVDGWKWVEGDSETHGKNARIEIRCKSPGVGKSGDFTATLEKTYFGGDTKFKTIDLFYKKSDTELNEFVSKQDPRAKTILMWPLRIGTKWATKMDNKTFRYEVVADDKVIKVQAGEFANCIQVRSAIEGYPGATNEYYAPDVGRVLVTISTSEGEKRNTELISYSPAVEETANKEEKEEKKS